MTVYIDTNTFSATPMLYGDADKKKPLPRVIPSVLLNEGIVRIGFLGDYAPTAGSETVCAVASIPAPGNPLRVLTSYGTQVGDLWEVPINFDATEIADALVNRGSVNLSMGIIVEGADVRREYQFWVQCFSSAQGEISPEETADAKTFADAARLSADNAAESESNAAQSATDAAESAAASAQSASNAKTSETNAKTSETNAAQSASDAAQSAADAQSSASSAAQSASDAAQSATNAKASETNAATSATSAGNSADEAESTLGTFRDEKATLEANVATNTANIDWLMMSGDGDWRTYMLTRAKLTGKNSYIAYVKTAIQNPESTEATLMKQAHTDLWLCENFMERRLPDSFWAVLFDGIKAYVENPTDVSLRVSYDSESGELVSDSPYFDREKKVSHVVDFSVTSAQGNIYGNYAKIAGAIRCEFGEDGVLYLPRCEGEARWICANCAKLPAIVIVPKVSHPKEWSTYAYRPEELWVYAPSSTESVYFLGTNSSDLKRLHVLLSDSANLASFFVSPVGGISSGLTLLDLHVASPTSLALGAHNSVNLNEVRIRGTAANITSMSSAYECRNGIDTNFTPTFDDDSGLVFPACTNAYRLSYQRRINKPFYFPALKSAVGAFYYGGLGAANIAITLNSLPAWDDGESHVIEFRLCSGIPHTATAEAFTFTDDVYGEVTYPVTDGVGCPIFTYDDENQTLRKAYAIATIKKGWDVVIA